MTRGGDIWARREEARARGGPNYSPPIDPSWDPWLVLAPIERVAFQIPWNAYGSSAPDVLATRYCACPKHEVGCNRLRGEDMTYCVPCRTGGH